MHSAENEANCKKAIEEFRILNEAFAQRVDMNDNDQQHCKRIVSLIKKDLSFQQDNMAEFRN